MSACLLWRTRLAEMLAFIVVILSFQEFVQGQDLGPRYKTVQRFCTVDTDCDQEAGESCWILFSGCYKGQCMCDPGSQFKDRNGKCRNLKLGGDECNALDRCPERMSCYDGECRCDEGQMTEDKRFCLLKNEKLVGEKCSPLSDTCYQRIGYEYKRSEAECSSDGYCRCSHGYKQSYNGCSKFGIGEKGCTRAHHCHGGALCIDGSCRCPSGYIPVSGNSKCAKIGAQYDLQKGDYCNEISQNKYCGFSLICHQCSGENNFKCAQYLESHVWAHVSKAPSLQRSNPMVVLALAVCSIFSVLYCWLL